MTTYYAPPSFPFAQLFPMGVAMVIMGVVQMALGVVDIVYTHLKYGPLCNEDVYAVDWKCGESPCENPSHIWAITAPGLWGGLITVLAGGFTTSLMYASTVTIKTKRDTSGVVCGFLAFPIGPAAITMCVVRLFFANSVFYCLDEEDTILVSDYLQFLLPIITATSLFVGWCLAFGILVSLCRRGRLSKRDEFDLAYNQRYHEDYHKQSDMYADPGRVRPYLTPEPYDYDRPRSYPWRDRALQGWRDHGPYTVDRNYGSRSADPYPSSSRHYRESPRQDRDYYTTKQYNRY